MTIESNAPASTVELPGGMRVSFKRAPKDVRVDLWLEAFDGWYRFHLDLPRTEELERLTGKGVFAIYGALIRGRYEAAGETINFAAEATATLAECHETIRLALVGGGMGVVDGAVVKVDAPRAKQLVNAYVVPTPNVWAWNVAAAILDTRIEGRPARPEEIGADLTKPVVPAGLLDPAQGG